MYLAPDGTQYSSYEEYCNSPLIDEDIKVILLDRGDRIPQNDYERRVKKELDEIRAQRKYYELSFD